MGLERLGRAERGAAVRADRFRLVVLDVRHDARKGPVSYRPFGRDPRPPAASPTGYAASTRSWAEGPPVQSTAISPSDETYCVVRLVERTVPPRLNV